MRDLDAYRSWLALHLLPDIGRNRFNTLLRHFGSPETVFAASRAELGASGIGQLATESILKWRELVDVDEEMRLIEKHGASLVCLDDDDYPTNLAHMAFPPPLLYYRGTLEPIDEAAVAVIGSRKMSRYGREAAEMLTRDLAQAGLTIVSGLALGIDSTAHRYALESGARTLAVLGNGLCHVYPAHHADLANEIIANGALISEMPMAAQPDPGSFPQRNAIIAGLSLGVLVIEAGLKSGTQITASNAVEDNRAVYAVPGDITRANSIGTNQLIKEGARLVSSAKDILADLAPQLRHLLKSLPDAVENPDGTPPPLPKDLNEVESAIYSVLELDPLSIDELMNAEGVGEIAMGPTMSALLSLELRGLVKQEPGKRFRRTR